MRGFRKKSYSRASGGGMAQEMALQITPMADVFTVILVFMLKSFSTSVSSVTPSQDLSLPGARLVGEVAETLKIEVSPSAVLVDGKPVMTLREFKFDAAQLTPSGGLKLLSEALAAEKGGTTGDEARKVLLLADRGAPYSTLKRILASASDQGFTDLSLLVVEEN